MATKKTRAGSKAIVPLERIERHIYLIRGEKVPLDADLAEMYGVTTGALNQAVKRNRSRFPADFMFQLSSNEVANLRSQSVISRSHGGRRFRAHAFTEQGVAMLSSVLRSPRAVLVNVQIMRTFVRLREMLASHTALSRKLDELEKKYDQKFRIVFDAIRQLMQNEDESQVPRRKPIGYHTEKVG
jgi:hypothetical protein